MNVVLGLEVTQYIWFTFVKHPAQCRGSTNAPSDSGRRQIWELGRQGLGIFKEQAEIPGQIPGHWARLKEC